MKILLVTIIILFNIKSIHSQQKEIDKLELLKKELELKGEKIKDSIAKIETRINFLKNKDNKYVSVGQDYTRTFTKGKAKIKNEPSLIGEVIGYISEGKLVKVYDYYDDYWLVEKDSIKGYTNGLYLTINIDMKELKKDHDQIKIRKKYGEEIAKKINSHIIWKGMTPEMARLSIGRPMEINRSTGSWGIHEQWVYKNKYLYFENGKLTSWQD